MTNIPHLECLLENKISERISVRIFMLLIIVASEYMLCQ